MRQTRLVAVLCVLAALGACDGSSPPATPSPPVEVSTVGQQVNRTFTGVAQYFELVSSKEGFLVGALSWDGTANGTVLLLEMNDTKSDPPYQAVFPCM